MRVVWVFVRILGVSGIMSTNSILEIDRDYEKVWDGIDV
jgi:hypothetical protein